MASKLYRVFHEPLYLPWCLWHKLSPLIKDDTFYLKIDYLLSVGHKLKLENPKTFNEKLQWLKLHDRRPEYTKMVDKYEAKEYVRSILGDEYIIPTLALWNKVEDIDISQLPNEFVLKCTHDSGCVLICKDKETFDIKAARKKLSKRMKKEFFLEHREWPYKNVKPRIIAEQYMVDESGTELKDYKFFCFNGTPKMLLVVSERSNDAHYDFLDLNYRLLPFERGHKNSRKTPDKPVSFDKMLRLAERLSRNIPFVRVDFYEINSKPYFGELTFYPASGCGRFEPEYWDYKVGSWLELPINK